MEVINSADSKGHSSEGHHTEGDGSLGEALGDVVGL